MYIIFSPEFSGALNASSVSAAYTTTTSIQAAITAAKSVGMRSDWSDNTWQTAMINTFKNCTFSNNSALHGSAIYALTDAAFDVSGSRFTNNIARLKGAAICRFHTVGRVSDSVFLNNFAPDARMLRFFVCVLFVCCVLCCGLIVVVVCSGDHRGKQYPVRGWMHLHRKHRTGLSCSSICLPSLLVSL